MSGLAGTYDGAQRLALPASGASTMGALTAWTSYEVAIWEGCRWLAMHRSGVEPAATAAGATGV